MNDSAQLDAVFSALSDPTRREILVRLADEEATVNELVGLFDISQPAVSKHLKVLERSGLVERRIDGTSRPASLKPEALTYAIDWLARYKATWEGRLDQLDGLLLELKTDDEQ